MNLYFAGDGRGDSTVSDTEWKQLKTMFVNQLLSYYNVKGDDLNLYFAGHCNNQKDVEQVAKQPLLSYSLIDEGVTDMNLYFAGGENKSWLEAIAKAKGNKSLYSFFGLTKGNTESSFLTESTKSQKMIFLDSGAYSAYTKGITINIKEYVAFIKKYKNLLAVYANLDVIGNEKATIKNQEYMESQGLHPLPVFHYGESWGYLKHLVKNYKYIAVGGLVPLSRKKQVILQHLNKCFSIIQNHCKVHGFGVTQTGILKQFPFYSVDSTAWLGGSMRAEIDQFNMGEMESIKTRNKSDTTFKSVQLIDTENKKWLPRVINNAIEWMKFEQFVTELWAKRGVVWND
jgi:hypothetical protein